MQGCEAQTCTASPELVHEAVRAAKLPVCASGLAARALTAAACHPACTAQQHASSLALWRDVFSAPAADMPTLAAAMSWFALFARVYPEQDFAAAVPQRLLQLGGPRASESQPGFLQMLEAAQRQMSGVTCRRQAGDGDGVASILSSCKCSIAAGVCREDDAMGKADVAGTQARAVRLSVARKCDIGSLAQGAGASGVPPGGVVCMANCSSGKGARAASATGRQGGFKGPGARSEALKDVLNTLKALHDAEVRNGGARANGIGLACQQLQSVVNGGII